ncbi:MATE family efflux transporter [Helicobacter anatolicus]|uniref:MATE family efflux transporter n=1 Tax=Helicobacter anatolicus TaxID=2905874 RepID=UPI001E49E4A5|nr:MATE family efflux transporter [Helicobacter anatolicus]MCE3038939.1 MATE family efflux transporter [Helicobacter anatolicus]
MNCIGKRFQWSLWLKYKKNSALKSRLKKIISLALPSGINSFLDIFNIAILLYFMKFFGDLYVLAIGVSLNYLMIFFAIHAIFYIGTNAQISRYFGAREKDKVQGVFISVCIFGSFVAIPIVVFAFFFTETFFYWIGIGDESLQIAKKFINLAIFTLPAITLKNIFISSLAGIGNTILPLFVRIFSTLFGLLLYYICIFGLGDFFEGRGIVGAAMANLFVAYLEVVVFIVILHYKTDFLKNFYFDKKYGFKALSIGIPAGIERFLTLFSLILTTKFIAQYGDLVLTGSQIGTRIEAFSFMPGFGFMVAAMVLMGQNLGARKIKVAALYMRTILWFSSIVLGVFGIFLACFSRELSSIFSCDSVVLDSSVYYLIAVGLSQVPMICAFVFDGALRGAGVTKITLSVNTLSIWIFRILPMAYVVHAGFSYIWLYMIIFMETYIRVILFWIVFQKGVWKNAGSEVC